jgi:hypothetical protein
MNEIKNGGSAFPTGIITNDKGVIIGGSNGMTLRDYFAAQALNGICANQDNRVYGNATEFATSSYRLADAMLKARGQE